MQNLLLPGKRILDHRIIVRFFFLFNQGEVLLTLSLVKEWLYFRNATVVAPFLKISVHIGSWWTDSSLLQVLECTFLDIPFKAQTIPISCAPFANTPFPPTQLSINLIQNSHSFMFMCLWWLRTEPKKYTVFMENNLFKPQMKYSSNFSFLIFMRFKSLLWNSTHCHTRFSQILIH